jgi:hypothetical protein
MLADFRAKAVPGGHSLRRGSLSGEALSAP